MSANADNTKYRRSLTFLKVDARRHMATEAGHSPPESPLGVGGMASSRPAGTASSSAGRAARSELWRSRQPSRRPGLKVAELGAAAPEALSQLEGACRSRLVKSADW